MSMTLFKGLRVLCCSSSLLLSSAVFAQTQVNVSYSADISLSSLVAKVYEKQPERLNQAAQQEVIKANNTVSSSLFAGQATVNLSHQNDVIGSDNGLQEWESSIDIPLWLSGQQQDQKVFTNTLAASLPIYKRQLHLISAAQVRDALWAVVKADTESQQHYQVWQTAKKIEQDVASRVKVGEMASTELLLVNTHAFEMQNDFLVAQATLQQSLDYYFTITGEHNLPADYAEALPDNVTITAEHPQLAVIDSRITSLQAQQNLAQYESAINPNLSVGVRRERQDRNEQFNNSVGVGISIALGNNVHKHAAVAQAAKELAEAQVSRQLMERELRLRLQRYQSELKAKQQQLSLIKQQLLVNQRYLQLQQNAFDLGEIDLVNLLRSQALADETESKKNLLEVEIKQTIAQLNQAAGLMP